MAAIHNITIDQGSDYVLDLTLWQDDSKTIPVDLTDCTSEMMVRRDYDKPPVIVASTTNGKISLTALTGKVVIQLLPSDTSSIRFAGESLDCVYDLEITYPGKVKRELQGTCVITREVTR